MLFLANFGELDGLKSDIESGIILHGDNQVSMAVWTFLDRDSWGEPSDI